MEKIFDLIIIGSGPAGLTAGIYSSRYNLDFLIIGKLPGGTISEAHKVCNYPSKNNISGFQLTQDILSHVKELGGEVIQEEVQKIEKIKLGFIIKTNKQDYKTKKIILATGTEKQKLGVEGEEEFLGKGVSYCATCDAAFYKNKKVAVVGGGNAAVTAALLLAEHAKEVSLIYRKDKFFRAEPAWVSQLEKEKKIKPMFDTIVKKIKGNQFVEELELEKKGKEEKLEVDGVFIEVGASPNVELIKNIGVELDKGYIKADKKQETNIKGLYGVGDVTNNYLKQVITASAEGAIAATAAYEELKLGE